MYMYIYVCVCEYVSTPVQCIVYVQCIQCILFNAKIKTSSKNHILTWIPATKFFDEIGTDQGKGMVSNL